MAAHQTVPELFLSSKSPVLMTPKHGVLTLFGYGIRVRVERGHLTIEDGIGADRREARLSRVGHGLCRLVVIGSDGFVSLAALHWMAAQKVMFSVLERDGSVLVTTGPANRSDARMRRAQALADHSGVAVQIARELISRKLDAQEKLVRKALANSSAGDSIAQVRSTLGLAQTIERIRLLESQAALAYWGAWKNLPIIFPKQDVPRVPDHWRTFGSRISPLTGSQRLAANPPNAMLNYLYTLLECEARLAVTALGLDPGLGFLHKDSRTRDSLACDVMEPVRPQVDAYVLEKLTHRVFRRKDFFEMSHGNCRLMAGLCVELSQTARLWSHAVAPYAELVSRMLWKTLGKPGRPPATRLTGESRRAARGGNHIRPMVLPPRLSKFCKGCGVECKKTYCLSCGQEQSKTEFDKGRLVAQNPESRTQRSITQKERVRANQNWTPSKKFDWLDKEAYITKIQPLLNGLTISELRTALGVSEPYATFIRSGLRVPHRRHWQVLAELTGKLSPNEG